VFELGSLFDAEAVLFVDDDESHLRIFGKVVEKGMGADDDVGVGKSFGGAGVEADGEVGVSKEVLEGLMVLVGEDFGGSHKERFKAAEVNVVHGDGGDDSFAGTDVAFEKAVHGNGLLDVAVDLVECVLLGFSEGEGEGFNEGLGGFGVESDGVGRTMLLMLLSFDGALELEDEEFVEGQAVTSRFEASLIGREVDVLEGGMVIDKLVGIENLLR